MDQDRAAPIKKCYDVKLASLHSITSVWCSPDLHKLQCIKRVCERQDIRHSIMNSISQGTKLLPSSRSIPGAFLSRHFRFK
jgi:hypothetical protein